MKREFRRRLERLPQHKAKTRIYFVTDDEPIPPLAPGEKEEDRIVFHTIYETKPQRVA
jgi:hypothetical protein